MCVCQKDYITLELELQVFVNSLALVLGIKHFWGRAARSPNSWTVSPAT